MRNHHPDMGPDFLWDLGEGNWNASWLQFIYIIYIFIYIFICMIEIYMYFIHIYLIRAHSYSISFVCLCVLERSIDLSSQQHKSLDMLRFLWLREAF